MGKGGTGPLRWPIDDGRQGCFRRFRLISQGGFDFLRKSKFGRTQLRWREMLSQFSSKVPNPLSQNLSKLLTTGGMGVPAIHLLLLVFISQHGLERAAMQVQIKHI